MVRFCAVQERPAQSGWRLGALVLAAIGDLRITRVFSCAGRGLEGRAGFNPSLTSLIGDLSTRSEEFRALWAAQNVRLHRSGVKHFRHPAVGLLDLMFEAMALEADEGLTLTATSSAARQTQPLLPRGAGSSAHPHQVRQPGHPARVQFFLMTAPR
jgi:hypothetical protein